MTTPSRVLADRYLLLERIGEGGMAVVHRAHDQLLDRDVAVKLLRPAYADDPEFVQRFRREARHAAALHDPRIVTIFDRGVDPATGADYIVMQLVDGPTVEALLAERGRLPLGQALRIGTETAEALQVAHEHGIVHRDVKPANILLDADGSVRVADFGIARAAGDSGATTSGVVIGSPNYVSPEQVSGEPITPASDIYSLGVVLYEMVSGHRPFDGRSAAATALQRLRMAPPAPSSHDPSVPPEIDAVVLRALERDPARRFASAADLATALEEFRLRFLGGVRQTGAQPRVGADRRPAAGLAAAVVGVGTHVLSPGRRGASDSATAMTRVVPARRATVAGEPVARVEDRRDRRRRAALPIPALLPVLAVLLVLLAAAMVGRGLGTRPGISPSPSSGASAVAGVPASRPAAPPSVEASPSASPTASPSESPSPIPKATPKPTQKPTPVATPRPTPRPTTRPTPAPTPTPKPASTAPSRDPAETVRRFYSLVVQHRFSEAAQLWSARMRQQYPPKQYIDGRFAATTGIDVRRDAITSESVARRTATVAVDLLEHRKDGSTRHWVGSWDLVLTSAGWLMNQPHF